MVVLIIDGPIIVADLSDGVREWVNKSLKMMMLYTSQVTYNIIRVGVNSVAITKYILMPEMVELHPDL